MDNVATGLLWYIAFLFSTTLHEASHAFAAMKLGDRTAYEGGQVTLNPFPHMRREPIGTVVVPLVSYFVGGWMIGWASVPYNLQWAQQYPKRSATMSLAGPAANLFLVIVSGLVIRAGIVMGFFEAPDSITFTHVVAATTAGAFSTVATFLDVFFSLNLLLCMFNLLPIPPLDGSGMIPFFLNENLSRKYLTFIRTPAFSIMGILLAWRVFDVIYSPLHLACVNFLYTGVGYYE